MRNLSPCVAGACGSRGRAGGRARPARGAAHDVGPALLTLLGCIAALDGPASSGRAGWSPIPASVLCGRRVHRSCHHNRNHVSEHLMCVRTPRGDMYS